jgi:predicted AAA+ superfamily ATPase
VEQITQADIEARIARDNPWWSDPNVPLPEAEFRRRVYFAPFKSLALNFSVRRATVLLGPRRVGKTVMVRQLIADAIKDGIDPNCILYASIDAPIYLRMPLEQFLSLLPSKENASQRIVIFDEIQYLRNWEVHLKDLVDNYPLVKFIATGSAAAALQLQSRESGAGRFSDFMLPPLTFYEFLVFTGDDAQLMRVVELPSHRKVYLPNDINALNERFIHYLNFGGYPEVVLNATIQNNPDQFVRNDIIDKVLLKDLPSLYGIREIPELNKLFSFLAYNAGNEATLENISQESGLTKPTITRYIEYLESAFLLMKLTTVDDNCRSMRRARHFKIYLNNPSMRAALFAPVRPEDTDRIGHLTESAIFSQWQHSPGFRQLRYARWRNEGEVDIVHLEGASERPAWIGEIKWSDRVQTNFSRETKAIKTLLENHKSIRTCFFTTKTWTGVRPLENRVLRMTPSAVYCYTVGRNITARLDTQVIEEITENAPASESE